jgi:hypothetical protein
MERSSMPNHTRWRYLGATRSDRLINLVFVTVAAILAAVVAREQFVGADQMRRPPGYAKGEPAPELQGLDFSRQERTVVLFATTRCRYCAESMPFYQRLGETVAGRRGTARFVVVSPEPAAALQAYLQGRQVSPSAVLSVEPRSVRVRGTPTLLVVDRRGQIHDAFEGKLTPSQEEAVLAAL